MLETRWIATCWMPCAILFLSVWGRTAAGESQQQQQQPKCLARNWREVEAGFLRWPVCVETQWDRKPVTQSSSSSSSVVAASVTVSVGVSSRDATASASPSSPGRADQELDTDSPLDNANFLSFEDWKKQNLAKAGQSAENVGGSRRGGAAGQDRRRPTGISNALDSLGEDAEIELDFGGFGADPSEAAKSATSWGTQVLPGGASDGNGYGGDGHASMYAGRDGGGSAQPAPGVPHSVPPRSKDAGTTCKERFNYASFDCAATVLKTNPEGKGSSSVLIENKDSYMLNECRARNKFLILELCDDILVDTVVLANYEFFSSIFHTFRVSVADRYPAKPDQWNELGIFEARNTREVQAFAVENPLIWARYLRIEFLTHYGHEFYCPLSLVRVHGTTMLEEYKHDGEAGRMEENIVVEPSPVDVATNVDRGEVPASDPMIDNNGALVRGPYMSETCPNDGTAIERVLLGAVDPYVCGIREATANATWSERGIGAGGTRSSPTDAIPSTGHSSGLAGGGNVAQDARDPKVTAAEGTNVHPAPVSSTSNSVSDTVSYNTTSETDPRSVSVAREEPAGSGGGGESTRSTATQPPSANPTTQESFFKSVNKRLQMLETSSSLSLQYIEEQSRILRDAFNKVEKRQLSKTSTFLEHLNVTVLNELKQFRDQYDQVWKSVALEFEHQRIQYHQEIFSLSAQLGVVADELVFQKRVAVIQSIMVLFCFALVLFSRGAASGYIELPSVQNMVSRSYSLRSSSPIFASPPGSPGSTREPSSYHSNRVGHRRELSDDSQMTSSPISPTIAYSPPTPTSEDLHLETAVAKGPEVPVGDTSASSGDDPEILPEEARLLLARSHSSPPVLNGADNNDEGCSVGSGMESSDLDDDDNMNDDNDLDDTRAARR